MFKKYSCVSEVRVGDVVCLETDTHHTMEGYTAFTTCVVTKFSEEYGVHLARPHVKVDKYGTVYTAHENFSCPAERFPSSFVAFTLGPSGHVDNRVSGETGTPSGSYRPHSSH